MPEISFGVKCSECGADLNATVDDTATNRNGRSIGVVIEIEPCKACCESAADTARDEGFKAGYETGFEEGCETAEHA